MSASGVPPVTPPMMPKAEGEKKEAPAWVKGIAIAGSVFGILIWFLYNYGAAKLSYAKHQSGFFAVLAFLFSSFYYPYYAFFENAPPAVAMMGGKRRK